MSDGYHLAREVRRMANDAPLPQSPLFMATITAVSFPTCKIRPTNASTAGDQLIATCLGVFPTIGARVVCCWIGGEPVVLGTIAAASIATRDFLFPISLYPDHVDFDFFGANSATTPSSTDTANMVTNFSGSKVLPAGGTFRVWVATWQLLSHSSEGGNVRWRTRINASNGSDRNANLNISTTRTAVMSWHSLGGLAGGSTVTYDAMYRPNASGTGTAGGGDGIAMVWRE